MDDVAKLGPLWMRGALMTLQGRAQRAERAYGALRNKGSLYARTVRQSARAWRNAEAALRDSWEQWLAQQAKEDA